MQSKEAQAKIPGPHEEDFVIQSQLDSKGSAPSSPGTLLGDLPSSPGQREPASPPHTQTRSTVLPRYHVEHEQVKPHKSAVGRYEEIAPIGRGGAGDVMLVKDNDIQRKVAVKTIRTTDETSIRMLRFIEEIKTTGQLEHPNIVPIHDVGLNAQGQYYYTMKYVDGDTLSSIIKKLKAGDPATHARFPFEVRTQIFVEILYAIHFAHKNGIIHRDLKPANIMIGGCGEVIVMDWGIAKRIRQTEDATLDLDQLAGAQGVQEQEDGPDPRHFRTQDGLLVGTPAYMSPEQVRGKNSELDERSDLYSICAMFYEFVTLEHYLGDIRVPLEKLCVKIVTPRPIRPEDISNPHQGRVPREIAFFLRRGLMVFPEKRFQSAREMLDELEGITTGRMCVKCPSTFLKRSAHEYGRYLDNHRYFGVVAFCLVLLFALFGIVQTVLLLL